MSNFPRLVSDIGGTNARFAIEHSPYQFSHIKTLTCKDYKTLAEVILAYLKLSDYTTIKHAALAVPSPIVDDNLFMLNSPWSSNSIAKTKLDTGLESLIFLNDFHALALAIPHISDNNLIKISGTEKDLSKPRCIIGPGTGLGMATLIKHPKENQYFAIPAEGGRSSFAPTTEEEFELWRFVHKRFHHVSNERLISGPGLQLIYEAVANINNLAIERIPNPNEITNLALNNQCYICKTSLDHFCRMLGTVSSNLACINSAFGGVYIGGGIVPQILDYFIRSDFLCRFVDKGRYRSYLSRIPIYIIKHDYPAMLGSAYALETYLNYNYIP